MIFALITFAIITTASHATGLIWAQRHPAASLAARKKAWRWHLLINGALWSVLFLWIIAAQVYFFKDFSVVSLLASIAPIVAGLYLSVAGHLALGGLDEAMGKRFFFLQKQGEWVKSGLYKYLANPIYDGFFLLLIGLAILQQAPENYYLAFASAILLNGVLALIESKGHRWKPF